MSESGPNPNTATTDRLPVIEPGYTYASVTDKIASIVLTKKTPLVWFLGFSVATMLLGLFLISATYLFAKGIGIWGVNIPNAWGYAITNFVWWVGIGHAGTLISAILLLLNQKWRNSINRFAEAMTLFAVACAGMFPILHLGRAWIFYWLFPYPNAMGIQPQFRSPLVWDVFAVSTYAIVSLLFWYIGLVPDLATLRDRSRSKLSYFFYGILSLGWRGASKHWQAHETVMLLMAGLATPLVLSVHTVVSFDFTIAILPGWHSTIFPPYFVAGAIYSGFAMVLILAIPLRKIYGLEGFITQQHLQNAAKLMLGTGLILAYTYAWEPFTAWYSGDPYEMAVVANRAHGPESWSFWTVIACNVVIPQALWFKRVRSSPVLLFFEAAVILYGMWLERFMLIITSLHRDYVPSSWANFSATFWDNATLFGSIGLFFFLFLLFIRFMPMISISELRELLPSARPLEHKK